jgi:hypothetical protein
MPVTFHWLAADRNGRLALFEAERWGAIPESAPLLWETKAGEALWRSVHAAWLTHVAPIEVFEHDHLSAIPESEAPHLAAFARPPPDYPGGEPVAAAVVSFQRVPDELRALIQRQDEDESEDETADKLVVGSLAIGRDSFINVYNTSVYAFNRYGDDPRYRRGDRVPRFSLVPDMLGGDAIDVPVLDVDFADSPFVDVEAYVPADQRWDVGRETGRAGPEIGSAERETAAAAPEILPTARVAPSRCRWWRRLFG